MATAGSVRASRSRRGRVLVCAATAVASLVAAGVVVAQRGGAQEAAGHAGGHAQISWAWYLACRSTAVEGDVISVRHPARNRQVVRLAASEWLKPAVGPTELTLDINANPPYFKVGSRYLFFVPTETSGDAVTDVSEGAEHVAEIKGLARGAMLESATLQCPSQGLSRG